MLWVCATYPDLPLEVLAPPPERPSAVLETRGNRRSLLRVNAAAAARGLSPGIPLATALNLVPELLALPRQRSAEQAALEAAACWAYRFGAPVSLDAESLCVWVEVEHSLSLFGGWPALAQAIAEPDETLSYRRWLGAAPTQACAAVLAGIQAGLLEPLLRCADIPHRLAALPLHALPLEPRAIHVLRGAGVRSVDALLALPLESLAQRFGTACVDYLQRLLGHASETWKAYAPPARFHRRFFFSEGVETTQALLFPLRPLLGELAAYLRARDVTVQRFELRLVDSRRRRQAIAIGLQAPTRDAAHLLRVLKERLERVQVQDSIVEIVLHAAQFEPAQALQGDLFSTAATTAVRFGELHERLLARLGSAAVRQVAVAPQVRADRSWVLRGAPGAQADSAAFAHPARPLWLLPKPVSLREAPQLLGPPERIEQGWWDGGVQARDYFLAQDGAGRLCWVFREIGGRGFSVQGYWQ